MDHQIFPSSHAQFRSSAGLRRIEKVGRSHSWVALRAIRQIQRGDVFRMFEPDGVQLPPDPAVWRAAFVSAQDNGSFYRDYHRTVTAWFAAALQRGAEEAFRALGKKYEDEINSALFPAITAK